MRVNFFGKVGHQVIRDVTKTAWTKKMCPYEKAVSVFLYLLKCLNFQTQKARSTT